MITQENIKDLVGRNVRILRDYSNFMDWMISKIPEITDEWTDFTITDPGIIYCNAIAYLFDHMHFRLDQCFLNNRLRWSKNLNQLYFMATFMGLEPRGYNSSTGIMSMYNSYSEIIDIPKGTHFSYIDSASGEEFLIYTTISRKIFPGMTSDVPCIQGDCHHFILEETDFDSNEFLFTPSIVSEKLLDYFDEFSEMHDGKLPNFNVSSTVNIALNSIELTLIEPSIYSNIKKVDDAILTLEKGISYSVHYTPYGPKLKISPGTFKLLTSKRIRIDFSFSNGASANVYDVQPTLYSKDYSFFQINPLTSQTGEIINSFISCSISEMTGGYNPYTVDELRSFIGSNTYGCDTLYLERDYNSYIKNSVDFKDKVAHISKVHDSYHKYGCKLYFIPADDTLNVKSLAADLYKIFNEKRLGAKHLRVIPSTGLKINFKFLFILKRNVSSPTEVYKTVDALLRDHFSRFNQEPPFILNRDTVSKLIESNFDEIDYVRVLYPTMDITCNANNFVNYIGCTIDYEFDYD